MVPFYHEGTMWAPAKPNMNLRKAGLDSSATRIDSYHTNITSTKPFICLLNQNVISKIVTFSLGILQNNLLLSLYYHIGVIFAKMI